LGGAIFIGVVGNGCKGDGTPGKGRDPKDSVRTRKKAIFTRKTGCTQSRLFSPPNCKESYDYQRDRQQAHLAAGAVHLRAPQTTPVIKSNWPKMVAMSLISLSRVKRIQFFGRRDGTAWV
jgi:hypothetical protein